MARTHISIPGTYIPPFFVRTNLVNNGATEHEREFVHKLSVANTTRLPYQGRLISRVAGSSTAYVSDENDRSRWIAEFMCLGRAPYEDERSVKAPANNRVAVHIVEFAYKRETWSEWQEQSIMPSIEAAAD